MFEGLLDPAVLCFALGLLAGLLKAELKLPDALYDALSVYLLLAIGFKGGEKLARYELAAMLAPIGVAVALGVVIPLVAYVVLRRAGKLGPADAAAVAAHYGSVSAVTFAVAQAFLDRSAISYEPYAVVLLVVMELPAIAVGVLLARICGGSGRLPGRKLAHEVSLNKSVVLLLGGMLVGYLAGPERMKALTPFFGDLFKGALTLFLLEMGLVTARRVAELKQVGLFLIAFGVLMPIAAGWAGAYAGHAAGLSLGGSALLAVLAASASYIAAPAAMRIAVPEANPTLYLGAALGVTFPFNVALGIPLYLRFATAAAGGAA
jgi:hypothetical protein